MLVIEEVDKIAKAGFFGYYAVEEPEECPLCHYAIKPEKLAMKLFEHNRIKYLTGLYRCTHCNQAFLTFNKCSETEYIPVLNQNALKTTLLYKGPKQFVAQQFDPKICDLSPQFVKIYNQAMNAESLELDEIAGIGYRKALEFLVKDFCIHLVPNEEKEIKRLALATCINKYLDNDRIKTLAERAVWIGNDQTHYVRKIEDRDLHDMKNFISAVVFFISMVLITEDAASIESRK